MRKKYIPAIYQHVMEEIRNELKDKFICIAADKTTDSCGRYIANLIVGALVGPNSFYLVSSKRIRNHSTIARFVCEGIQKILHESGAEESVVIFVRCCYLYYQGSQGPPNILSQFNSRYVFCSWSASIC